MDDKKLINTQHVKYIETLSRGQNSSLLHPVDGHLDGTVDDTGLATDIADSHPARRSINIIFSASDWKGPVAIVCPPPVLGAALVAWPLLRYAQEGL